MLLKYFQLSIILFLLTQAPNRLNFNKSLLSKFKIEANLVVQKDTEYESILIPLISQNRFIVFYFTDLSLGPTKKKHYEI